MSYRTLGAAAPASTRAIEACLSRWNHTAPLVQPTGSVGLNRSPETKATSTSQNNNTRSRYRPEYNTGTRVPAKVESYEPVPAPHAAALITSAAEPPQQQMRASTARVRQHSTCSPPTIPPDLGQLRSPTEIGPGSVSPEWLRAESGSKEVADGCEPDLQPASAPADSPHPDSWQLASSETILALFMRADANHDGQCRYEGQREK